MEKPTSIEVGALAFLAIALFGFWEYSQSPAEKPSMERTSVPCVEQQKVVTAAQHKSKTNGYDVTGKLQFSLAKSHN